MGRDAIIVRFRDVYLFYVWKLGMFLGILYRRIDKWENGLQ